jgi:hypothetical protein
MPIRHRRRRTIGHGKEKRLKPYYTVVVAYRATGATPFHPTTSIGPFSKLSRGAFPTASAARKWAREHLGFGGWKVKRITETAFLGVK